MCQTIFYKSKICRHRWLSIVQKCHLYNSFSTPIHEFKTERNLFGRPIYHKAVVGSCPECDKRGIYDHEHTRMVIADGCKEFKQATGMDFNKYAAGITVGCAPRSMNGVTRFEPPMQTRQIGQMGMQQLGYSLPPMVSYLPQRLSPYQQQFAARQIGGNTWPLLTSRYMAAPQTQRAVCYLKWNA